jgi:5'-3' exonuclease
MQVHLVDGTYELFRSFFGAPASRTSAGREVGATRGFARSLLAWLRSGKVTHAAYAFDHVIESFRNDLFDGYKTGDGVEPDLVAQFPLAEQAAHALGVTVWPMIEFEADDALATAAAALARDKRVAQIVIASPDKDLAQCVVGQRVVTCDRFRDLTLDEAAVVAKFGVPPASIADLLALTGDPADGVPGLPRWGAKSAAAVLAEYRHLESIPDDAAQWTTKVRGAAALAESLRTRRDEAMLYRKLTTLRRDATLAGRPLDARPETIAWHGVRTEALAALCAELEDDDLRRRASALPTFGR